MTDEIPDAVFHEPKNLAVFNQRVTDFIKTYFKRDSETADLYRGFVSHVLADGIFRLIVRRNFVEQMKKENIDQDDLEFYKRILFDMECIDKILAKNYPFKNDIVQELEKENDYEIADYLTKQELNASKNWVIESFFKGDVQPGTPVYYSLEAAMNFIDEATENIVEQLSNRRDFPAMFFS